MMAHFPLLASPDWHEGLVGIAAGRLVDTVYGRQRSVISAGMKCDSRRSLGKFDLVEALAECQSQTGLCLDLVGINWQRAFLLTQMIFW